jgi:dimethylamine/trimethylamine dehydrogenase
VRDYRRLQIQTMANVTVYFESRLGADDVLSYGFEHVALATGASWRRDGVARFHTTAIEIAPAAEILTPDDLMSGQRPSGKRVVLYDDDHYYMGGVLAELLAAEEHEVTLVTPAADVSSWTHKTMEQRRIQTRLIECGVRIVAHRALAAVGEGHAVSACVFTGRREPLECDAVVLVTARLPEDAIYRELVGREAAWRDAGIRSIKAIGDAWAPATIAVAVYEGHRYAEELDEPEDRGDSVPFRREMVELGDARGGLSFEQPIGQHAR